MRALVKPWEARARTSGESETIHRRALIAPDEIGQVFASVRDKEHDAYPGLALAVIAGEKAIALRRVNYYEDYEFIGCFDAHPDHAAHAPHRLRIRREALTPYIRCLPNLRIEILVKPGQVVSKGQALASVASGKTSGAYIRSPLAGKVESVDRQDEDGADVLFAILHYAYTKTLTILSRSFGPGWKRPGI